MRHNIILYVCFCVDPLTPLSDEVGIEVGQKLGEETRSEKLCLKGEENRAEGVLFEGVG